MRRNGWVLGLIAVAAFAAGYPELIETWRKERAEALRAPDGWLTVSGLFWLREGENTVGSDPSAGIQLPAGRAPLRTGVFDYRHEQIEFRPAAGTSVKINGRPAQNTVVKTDAGGGEPDRIAVGDFTLFVIQRGERFGVRVRDVHSPMREHFAGLKWYPVKPQYRVVARWHAYATPQTIAVPNVLGAIVDQESPGYAEFELGGRTLRLHPVLEDQQLFFVFRDLTAQTATYESGRFLDAAPARDGKVILDFNKAYNPPCAFTAFATCPLPPKQNRLPVAIEAGEMRYPGAGH